MINANMYTVVLVNACGSPFSMRTTRTLSLPGGILNPSATTIKLFDTQNTRKNVIKSYKPNSEPNGCLNVNVFGLNQNKRTLMLIQEGTIVTTA
jgi:hypothetical protein